MLRRWLTMTAVLALTAAGHSADEPAKKAAPAKPEWKVLCDGKSLKNWKITEFGGEGAVEVVDGTVVMAQGSELTGIHWTGEKLPNRNYEVSLEAQRVQGSDFFCGIVFPVGDSFCSFVVGGWGGGVVGLSAVDGLYAVDNQTVTYDSFTEKKWYKVRLRVSDHMIQGWINEKRVFQQPTEGHKFTVHPAVDLSKPLGVSCFSTVAALKDIKLRELSREEVAEKPAE